MIFILNIINNAVSLIIKYILTFSDCKEKVLGHNKNKQDKLFKLLILLGKIIIFNISL